MLWFFDNVCEICFHKIIMFQNLKWQKIFRNKEYIVLLMIKSQNQFMHVRL